MDYWQADEFRKCLDDLRPKIGRYEWMWKLMRARAGKSAWLPHRLAAVLRRLGNPAKPYFISKTSDGNEFVGDYRDSWSVHSAVFPDFDSDVREFLKKVTAACPGAYVDLGTNVGIVATAMAKHLNGRDQVYAFEPVAETAKRAAATFALNGLTNVSLFTLAIGDVNEEITFYDAPGYSEGASANRTDYSAISADFRWTESKVMCRTLDSLMEDGLIDGRIGLIKVDIEGNELKAISGSQKTVKANTPAILFEFHPVVARQANWRVEDVAALLKSTAEYKFHVLADGRLSSSLPDQESKEVVDLFCEPPGCTL